MIHAHTRRANDPRVPRVPRSRSPVAGREKCERERERKRGERDERYEKGSRVCASESDTVPLWQQGLNLRCGVQHEERRCARRAVSTAIGRREIRANKRRSVERETPSWTVVRAQRGRLLSRFFNARKSAWARSAVDLHSVNLYNEESLRNDEVVIGFPFFPLGSVTLWDFYPTPTPISGPRKNCNAQREKWHRRIDRWVIMCELLYNLISMKILVFRSKPPEITESGKISCVAKCKVSRAHLS